MRTKSLERIRFSELIFSLKEVMARDDSDEDESPGPERL